MALNTISAASWIVTDGAGYPGPFRDGNGNLYVVATGAVSPNSIDVYKSTNGGSTWVAQDTANNPITSGAYWIHAAVLDDTVIHIANHDNFTGGKTQNIDIMYHTFNTSDAGSNPDTWQIVDEAVVTVDVGDAADVTETHGIEIAVRSDGDVIVFHPGTKHVDMGTHYFNQSYSRRESASWTTDIALTNEAFHQHHPRAVMAPNDECHFVYYTQGQALYGATLDSANSLSTRISVLGGEGTLTDEDSARPITWDNGGTQQILVVGSSDSGGLQVRRLQENGSGDLATDLAAASFRDSPALAPINIGLAWDAGNGDAYVFFIDGDSDLVYDVGANGTGWGTDVEQEDAITVNGVWINFYNSTIGYVVLDGTTLKYGELAITAPATVYPPYRRRQLTTTRM